MAWGEGEGREEAARKERFFRTREAEEAKAAKELHYQRLITENAKLKDALKMAIDDIEDWMAARGEDPNSRKLVTDIRARYLT